MRLWCCCFGDIWEKMNEGKGEENGYGDLGNDESRSLDSRRRKALDRFMDGEGSSGTAVEGESSAGMELGMGSSSNFDEFGSGSNEGIIINVDFLDDVIPVQMTKGSRDSQHKRAKVHSDYMEHHYENVLSLGLDRLPHVLMWDIIYLWILFHDTAK
ncbi:hypothetical protein IFM89_021632 [Coptis chinensis]|uniref:Uncharacterized protein n=1 Tax=Coptis chinensis TaxID=261450 RepID=A0A835IC17_9MAGN|nr:hypothetical protein IFM89_021632 [Coptis chinensis]